MLYGKVFVGENKNRWFIDEDGDVDMSQKTTTNVPFVVGDKSEELRGIPLTALLVIRNIARNPQNHALFSPFEKDLSTLLVSQRFGKVVSSVFAELK